MQWLGSKDAGALEQKNALTRSWPDEICSGRSYATDPRKKL